MVVLNLLTIVEYVSISIFLRVCICFTILKFAGTLQNTSAWDTPAKKGACVGHPRKILSKKEKRVKKKKIERERNKKSVSRLKP